MTAMTKMMRLSLNTLTAAAVTLLASACSESAEPSLPEVDDEGMVYFTINVSSGSIGGSRADGDFSFDNGLSPYEQMQTLRAIIVRSTPDNPATDGLIEHNELIYSTNNNQGVNLSSSGFLKVIGGEKKNVYLFANENHTYPSPFTNNNLTPKLNNLTIGKKFPAEEFIGMEIEFPDGTTQQPIIDNETSRAKKYLPMSERFEITVDKLNDDASNRYQSADLFVTRAAVKYGFYIDEKSTFKGDVKITEITVDHLADREYLLPQTTGGAEAPYEPSKYPVTDADHLITDYVCPDDTQTFSYTFKPDNFGVTYQPTEGETSLSLKYEPAIYFHESPKREKYTISITGDFGKDSDGNSIKKKYSDIELPNLPYLARNTFVKVYISFGKSEINCKVDLVPYGEVILEPSFGIDPDDKNP